MMFDGGISKPGSQSCSVSSSESWPAISINIRRTSSQWRELGKDPNEECLKDTWVQTHWWDLELLSLGCVFLKRSTQDSYKTLRPVCIYTWTLSLLWAGRFLALGCSPKEIVAGTGEWLERSCTWLIAKSQWSTQVKARWLFQQETSQSRTRASPGPLLLLPPF